jgi:hypothetical protein
VSPAAVKKIVARHYSVSLENIAAHSRIPAIVSARQMAMYLCRSVLGMSYPAIGRSFKRDHTSVMQAVARVESDPTCADDIRALTTRVITGFNTVGPDRVHRCAGCLATIHRDGVYCSKRCCDADQAWLDRREVA